MPAVEKYHNWEITLGQSKKHGVNRLAVRATNPQNPNDLVMVRTGENEESLDYRTLVIRAKPMIAEMEYRRAKSQNERKIWEARLRAAVEANEMLRLERRAQKLVGAPQTDDIVHKIIGGSVKTAGGEVTK